MGQQIASVAFSVPFCKQIRVLFPVSGVVTSCDFQRFLAIEPSVESEK
jgi:hypothetical protein